MYIGLCRPTAQPDHPIGFLPDAETGYAAAGWAGARTQASGHPCLKRIIAMTETPEYFQLRPEVEKAFGYSHAVRIGRDIKVSGAVSMDDAGNPTAIDDMEQQMKNVYSDLAQVLKHYGCTFDDVIVENVFTTDMAKFLEASSYRNSIYTRQFPAGSWLEVKGLALPGFLIEIEVEAHKSS
jgi:2-iminobutanoate/2-iminopropanoate deaminase